MLTSTVHACRALEYEWGINQCIFLCTLNTALYRGWWTTAECKKIAVRHKTFMKVEQLLSSERSFKTHPNKKINLIFWWSATLQQFLKLNGIVPRTILLFVLEMYRYTDKRRKKNIGSLFPFSETIELIDTAPRKILLFVLEMYCYTGKTSDSWARPRKISPCRPPSLIVSLCVSSWFIPNWFRSTSQLDCLLFELTKIQRGERKDGRQNLEIGERVRVR
jgi:hypothetical protein